MPQVEDTFFLDPNFAGSLQSQIQQIVASAILAGRLQAGEKLPSSRKLAEHLGISRITVTLAYHELVAEDYITSASRSGLRHTGCRQYPIGIDRNGLRPELLPEQLNALFITPNHQCPTTTTMSMKRRHELLRLAKLRDFLIVEDDYEFETSFIKPASPALKSMDRDGRVIYVGSFSKSLFPGLRLGYLVASAPFIRQARALRLASLRHPPGYMQRTTAYFLRLGHYDAMIKRMRNIFQKRRQVTISALAKTELKIANSASFGGSGFWVEAPQRIDTEELQRRLDSKGVIIEAGNPFFARKDCPKNFFRLAYSSISSDRIPEGIRRIGQEVKAV